jgi:hypothetical protein
MNCQLRDITVTARDGRVSHLDQVYIRGSHVRYFIVPDMLRYAGFTEWKTQKHTDGKTIGMRPCSEQETRVEEVLVWPEVVLRSTGPEVKEAHPEDKQWATRRRRITQTSSVDNALRVMEEHDEKMGNRPLKVARARIPRPGDDHSRGRSAPLQLSFLLQSILQAAGATQRLWIGQEQTRNYPCIQSVTC